MNKVYKHIWSKTQGRLVVVSECARGARGRKSGRRKLAAGLMASTLLSGVAWADDLPTGGQIVAGTGTIATTGNTLTVNQSTDKLIANWQGFSIGENNTVTFNQPDASSVALNRVVGQDPSQILGNLNANGQVFLLNPNGIAIGSSGSVQTGGFVASTLEMTNEDFLSGTYQFKGIGGTITNQGDINGNVVALIAPTVTNDGTLTGDASSDSATGVALAAGTDVLLDFDGDGLLSVEVKANTLAGLVENNGLIQADGGVAILTAKGASDALKGVVNNAGTVQAQTLAKKDGRILLLGDMDNGEVKVAGTLDASAPDGGDGGFIETSAATVRVSDDVTITTQSTDGHTGTWLIDPNDYTIAATGGDITGATLSSQLGSNNVIIESVNGATDGNGDIFVNDTVSWSANTLTLNAERNIEINTAMNASGTAGLALEYNQADGGGDYVINAPVNLAATGSFSTQDGSAGSVIDYTIITSLGAEGSTTGTDLQGIDGDSAGHYVLGADIDASDTASWNSGNGFNPLGNFTGQFDGLGHTISELTINRPGTFNVGLFSYTEGATISNVGLVGGSVTGDQYVGGLVGYNDSSSTINNAYTTGSVTGSSHVGGLVGENYSSTLNNVYTTGNVSGERDVGGLVGMNDVSTISNAYATGNVSADINAVGGLVGYNYDSSINNAYATGSVTSDGDFAGGLVGVNDTDASISNVFATGSVTGSGDYIGGLVGLNFNATVTNSFWNLETTSQSTGIGDDNNSQTVTGLTTSEMLNFANYSGFDSSIWSIKEGETSAYLSAFDRHSVLLSDGAAYLSVQTLDELQAINRSLTNNYVLFNDIDASATSDWNSGEGFDPLGDSTTKFSGNFDGLGHTISDLTINRASTTWAGLFGYVQGASSSNAATIQNLGLVDANIDAFAFVGGLAGHIKYTTVDNVYVTGTVAGFENLVGGLVGLNDTSTITGSFSSASVSGQNWIGGLVGQSLLGNISDSYATGNVTGDDRVGGLLGDQAISTVANAYATGSVTGTTNVGGLVGDNSGTITNGYYGETTGQSDTGKGTRLTTSEMLNYANYAGFDSGIWSIKEGQTSAYLNALERHSVLLGDGEAYLSVSTLDELQAINNGLSGHYALFSDIDASDTATWNSGEGFDPLGDEDTKFTGQFDGLGHTISELTIYRPGEGAIGLFGHTAGASISNVGLVGGSAVGKWFVGGLVGYNDAASSISNAYATGNVMGDWFAGGLVGYNDAASSISNVYATGSVSGGAAVGGLVGYNDAASISNAYATGSVTGVDDHVGGLVGYNYNASISNAYATGSVTSNGDFIGGLVGYNDAASSISNAYATGSMTGSNDHTGGLVGYNDNATITDSFWNTETTTQSTGIGDDNNSQTATGLTTAQMQDPFIFIDAGWDFASVWGKSSAGENNGYMMLRDVGDGTLYDDYARLSDTNTAKTYGDANPELFGITLDGVGTGNVILAWNDAMSETTNAGNYVYGTSVLDVTTTSANGVYVDYGSGALTIDKAALSVTASDANKTYDGLAFNGGNGISFDGFVAGEDESVLSGTLAYGGDAQNAVNAGSYTLSASGLTSGNYDVNYVDGTLTVNKAVISSVTTHLLPEQINRISLSGFDGRTDTLLDPDPELIEIQATSDNPSDG